MITRINIDPIRAEIMRLEGLQVFDQAGWERVLADLRAQGREHGLADAERRMRSAMGRQWMHVGTDLGMPGGDIQVTLVPVKGHRNTPMIDWMCPKCGGKNKDFCHQGTCCAFCGRAIWVGGNAGAVWDEGWNVDFEADADGHSVSVETEA